MPWRFPEEMAEAKRQEKKENEKGGGINLILK